MSLTTACLAVLLVACLVPACSMLQAGWGLLVHSTDEVLQREREQMTKDWCLTIRACQVIPVYPLTEDLQPGDLFLVSYKAGEEKRAYDARGFLPLDRHIGRITTIDYETPYESSFDTRGRSDTPHHWRIPPTSVQAPSSSGSDVTATAWAKAPIAFFPTYSFSVRRGSGARIAIPASSLPVGLGLLRADEVTGTVVLADSRVYGVPLESLWQQVQDWAGAAHVRDMLKALAVESDGDPVYVRVVSRVYLVGRIDVSLINSSTAVAQAEVGLPPEIKLLEQPSEDATKRFKEANAALNSILASATEAGGAVKFTHVSRRAVTAKETFSRPLVIGYLGFDFPVLGTGELGIPVATTRTLAGEPPEGGGHALGRFTSDQWVIGNLRAAIRSFDAGQQDEIYAAAARDLGAEFEIAYLAARRINATLPARDAFTATLVALDASPEWSRHRVRESLAKALSQFTQENSQ